jgi:hypothetical protein
MSVKIVAYDLGIPPLSSTLTLSVLIQVSNSVLRFSCVKIWQTLLLKVRKTL